MRLDENKQKEADIGPFFKMSTSKAKKQKLHKSGLVQMKSLNSTRPTDWIRTAKAKERS